MKVEWSDCLFSQGLNLKEAFYQKAAAAAAAAHFFSKGRDYVFLRGGEGEIAGPPKKASNVQQGARRQE